MCLPVCMREGKRKCYKSLINHIVWLRGNVVFWCMSRLELKNVWEICPSCPLAQPVCGKQTFPHSTISTGARCTLPIHTTISTQC